VLFPVRLFFFLAKLQLILDGKPRIDLHDIRKHMKTQKTFFCFALALCACLNMFAQVVFQKAFSLQNESTGLCTIQTADGGFMIAGTTGGSNSYSQGTITLTKTDQNGTVLWNKNYIGNLGEYVSAIIENPDGTYTLIGATYSGSSGPYGDALMMKVTSTGVFLWNKAYTGSAQEYGTALMRLPNGGYVFCGTTRTNSAGGDDLYIVRTDSLGTPVWSSRIGGGGNDNARSLVLADDGSLMVFGGVASFANAAEAFLCKLNITSGNLMWNKRYSNIMGDVNGMNVLKTTDGGYFLSGWCYATIASAQNFYILKTDSAGSPIWSHVYGGIGEEIAFSACATSDGGFAICGSTRSFGAGQQDMYLIRVNSLGSMQWSSTYGTPGNEIAYNVVQATDGGFVLTGVTSTGFFAGYSKMMVVKTDALGYTGCDYIPATSVKYSDTAIVNTATPVIGSMMSTYNVPFTTTSGILDSTLCSTVSIFEPAENLTSFSLFPNPSTTTATLSFENTTPKEIRVLNLLGQEVFRLTNTNEQRIELTVENWPSGVYVVEVKSGSKLAVQKLIVD
jgi:hypothetical protein